MRARKSVLEIGLNSLNQERALGLKGSNKNGFFKNKKKGTFKMSTPKNKVSPLISEEQAAALLNFASTETGKDSPKLKPQRKKNEQKFPEDIVSPSLKKPVINQFNNLPMGGVKFESLKSNQLQMIDDLSFFKDMEDDIKILRDNQGIWNKFRNACSNIERSYKLISRIVIILLRRSLFGLLSKFKIISPKSKFIVLWDFLILLTILWNFMILTTGIFFGEPYSATYLFSDNQRAGEQYIVLLWFFFVIQSADVLIKFITGYFENGELIVDPEKIVKRYFRNQFIFHLVNTILLSLQFYHEYSPDDGDKLKLFQIIYVINIKRLNSLIRSLEEYFFFEDINDAFFALIQLFLKMFAISHCMACVWHGVGQVSKCNDNTWLETYDLMNKNWQSRYVYSLYWAITTLTTIGYGDITPRNNNETILASFCMFLGSGLFGYLMSTIGTIVEKINEKETQFKKDMLMMSRILKKKEIDNNLQYKVKQYLEYVWKEESKVNHEKEHELMEKLSLSLREELLQQSYGRIIDKFPVLSNNFSEKFLRSLVHVMKVVRYSPEELVFQEFASGDRNLYLIAKGQVEVSLFTCKRDKPFTQIKTLNKWESIGEISFFTDRDVSATAKSIGFSLVYIIKRSDFIDILKENPQDYETFCQLRDQYIIYKDFTRLYMKCYSCGAHNHSLFLCPALYYNARVEKQIKRELNSEGTQSFRLSHNRRESKQSAMKNFLQFSRIAERYKRSIELKREDSKGSISPKSSIWEEDSGHSLENLDIEKPKQKSVFPEIYLLQYLGSNEEESKYAIKKEKLYPLGERLNNLRENAFAVESILKTPKLIKDSLANRQLTKKTSFHDETLKSLEDVSQSPAASLKPFKKRDDVRKSSYIKALSSSVRNLPPLMTTITETREKSKTIVPDSTIPSLRKIEDISTQNPQDKLDPSKTNFSPPHFRPSVYNSDDEDLLSRSSFLNYGDNMFLRGFDAMKNWDVYFTHNNPDLIIMKMQNSDDAEENFELKSLKKKLYEQRKSVLITAINPMKEGSNIFGSKRKSK